MTARSGCQSFVARQWLSSRPPPLSAFTGPAAVEMRTAGEGRGMGLFAVRDIPQFAQILIDGPIVVMSPGEDLPELYLRFRNLSPDDQKQYLGLSHREDAASDALLKDKLLQRGFGSSELEQMAKVANVMQTNAFNVDLGNGRGSNHRALFLKVARINHSCAPNAHVCFYPPGDSGMKGLMVIHALKQIQPGKEVLISYFSILLSRPDRQAKTRKWGFECECSVCTGPEHFEHIRGNIRDFQSQQTRFLQRVRVTIKDINALTTECESLVALCKSGHALFPALPELLDGLAMLRAKALAVQKRENEREPVLEALEESTLWDARITGQNSPATAKRLSKLAGLAAGQGGGAVPKVVRHNGDYAIEWTEI